MHYVLHTNDLANKIHAWQGYSNPLNPNHDGHHLYTNICSNQPTIVQGAGHAYWHGHFDPLTPNQDYIRSDHPAIVKGTHQDLRQIEHIVQRGDLILISSRFVICHADRKLEVAIQATPTRRLPRRCQSEPRDDLHDRRSFMSCRVVHLTVRRSGMQESDAEGCEGFSLRIDG
jgi:hypothetical protein